MRFVLYTLLVIVSGFAAELVVSVQAPAVPPPQQPVSISLEPLIVGNYLVAAPGRVEPASEEVAVGAALIGVLKEVTVKEGDRVSHGQVVATIENSEYRATLAKAEAQLRLRETERLRLNNGARPQERKDAQAAVQEAEAVVRNTVINLERRKALAAQGYSSLEALDQAQREASVARQRLESARQKFALVDDKARDEDIAIAEAQVDVAKGVRDEAAAQVDKTMIRSPIDGTVLRVTRHAGELVSTFFNQPVVTIGDVSQLFVRADVDEADIGKVRPGMTAYVTADAFGDHRFSGRVTRIGRMVGKKNVYTDEAKEHIDNKILEVMIALDDPTTLPPGLRVNAFMTGPQTVARQDPPSVTPTDHD